MGLHFFSTHDLKAIHFMTVHAVNNPEIRSLDFRCLANPVGLGINLKSDSRVLPFRSVASRRCEIPSKLGLKQCVSAPVPQNPNSSPRVPLSRVTLTRKIVHVNFNLRCGSRLRSNSRKSCLLRSGLDQILAINSRSPVAIFDKVAEPINYCCASTRLASNISAGQERCFRVVVKRQNEQLIQSTGRVSHRFSRSVCERILSQRENVAALGDY